MLFAAAPEHRKFFNKNGYIVFEDVLPIAQIDELKQKLDALLAKKQHCSLQALPKQKTQELFLHGRDMWREDPLIKKISLSRSFGEVASDLFFTKPLRIGYDQYFHPGLEPIVISQNLHDACSLQKVVGGLYVQLSDIEQDPLLPLKKGSVLFVSAKLQVNIEVRSPLLQIVYCMDKTRYFPQAQDPHANFLKKLGYQSGELILNTTHPIVAE